MLTKVSHPLTRSLPKTHGYCKDFILSSLLPIVCRGTPNTFDARVCDISPLYTAHTAPLKLSSLYALYLGGALRLDLLYSVDSERYSTRSDTIVTETAFKQSS